MQRAAHFFLLKGKFGNNPEAVIAIITNSQCPRIGSVRPRNHRHLVGLPDIDLSAASAILASACVWVSVTWASSFQIGFTIDELEVVESLNITISQTHLGNSIAVLAFACIGFHLRKVQGNVQTTIQKVEPSTV